MRLPLAARIRGLLDDLAPRPVVVHSPYPPDECARRLAEATTHRGRTSWYLHSRTALLPDPRFFGKAGPSGVRLTRHGDVNTRYVVPARLSARPEPADDGGTNLVGTLGRQPEGDPREWLPLLLFSLFGVVCVLAGVVFLTHGQLGGLIPIVVPPLALPGVAVYHLTSIRKQRRASAAKLVEELHEVLDSSVADGPSD